MHDDLIGSYRFIVNRHKSFSKTKHNKMIAFLPEKIRRQKLSNAIIFETFNIGLLGMIIGAFVEVGIRSCKLCPPLAGGWVLENIGYYL
ncbi:hypothetical protein [Pseudaquidulcibacter saccharophilus]|uniref:hypothetical protein n=1 Tax=Pseudaquidulcibacter saccharophilus TaxID=2831900 RepID=UPI001EFEFF0C|nr:hypothetical protein [Pseudaquidulcibacter saccharophilus]